MTKALQTVWWTFLCLTAVMIAIVSYVSWFGATPNPEGISVEAQFRDRPIWFLMHVGGGATALLLGPWQFLSAIRQNMPIFHRIMGSWYILSMLIGGTGGLYIAFYTDAGLVAQLGFGGLAIAWFYTTGMAVNYIGRRNFTVHREWMIRSYALTFAAVTLRIYMPLGSIFLVPNDIISGTDLYIAISWVAWVPNLVIAEWYIRRMRPSVVVQAA